MNKITINDLLRFFCEGKYKTNEPANRYITHHMWFHIHVVRNWFDNDNISGVALAIVAKQLGWETKKQEGRNWYRVLNEEDMQKYAQFFE